MHFLRVSILITLIAMKFSKGNKMKKSELSQIIKEELQKVLAEKSIDIPDYGYGTDYYGIKSNIMEKWDDLAIIKKDIKGYISSAYDAGGEDLAKEVITALLTSIKESQALIKKEKSSNNADYKKQKQLVGNRGIY